MFARLTEHPAVLLVLIVLIVTLFGYKRLPDFARNLGRSTRILKSEIDELKTENQTSKTQDTGAATPVTTPDGATHTNIQHAEAIASPTPLPELKQNSPLTKHAHVVTSKTQAARDELNDIKRALRD